MPLQREGGGQGGEKEKRVESKHVREGGKKNRSDQEYHTGVYVCVCARARVCISVCVFVFVCGETVQRWGPERCIEIVVKREREGGRERERERQRERSKFCHRAFT